MLKPFFVKFFVCFILFLSLLRHAQTGPDDPVNIPDAALRAYIEERLGKMSGDTITERDMNGMSPSFRAGSRGIKDLTGLEHATGITEMNFINNRITDLSPLANLTQLQILSLTQNKNIVDLSPLTRLTALTELRMRDNKIKDLSPLAGLTA